jgi:hypothetical protein
LIHEEEEIIAFCKTCEDPICLICSFGTHDGHERTTLEECTQYCKEEYNKVLEETKSVHKDFEEFKTCLDQVKKPIIIKKRIMKQRKMRLKNIMKT